MIRRAHPAAAEDVVRIFRETDGAANEERAPDVLYEWRPTREGAEA